MRMAVFGAGAIGGHLAVRLALAGVDVSVVARGAHLAAIRSDGLRMGDEVARPRASDDAAELGLQDIVFVTLKSHQLSDAAGDVAKLLGPDTAVVTAMNGLPYWYFHGLGGEVSDRRIESVDPDGRIRAALPPERAIGCLTFVAAEVTAPGVIHHTGGVQYLMGEPDGSETDRLAGLVDVLRGAGIDARAGPDIRADIWLKVLGNVVVNPVTALTSSTVGDIARDPGVRDVLRRGMEECRAVAGAWNVEIPISTEDRIERTASFTGHRSSMLQDLERGRPLEIDPIVRSVAELGDMAGIDTPTLDAIYALVRLRAAKARTP